MRAAPRRPKESTVPRAKPSQGTPAPVADTSALSGTKSRRRFASLALWVGVWTILAVMISPAGGLAGAALVTPHSTPAALAGHGPIALHAAALSAKSVAPSSTANRLLPGTTPIGSAVDPVALAMRTASLQANNSRALALYNLNHPHSSTGVATLAATPSLTFPTGTFTGYVNRSTGARNGIIGAQVQAFSLQGAYCPTNVCSVVSTGSDGSFSVTCPVGSDYVQASQPWNLTNITFAQCRQSTITSVGTIFLIGDAIVTATVEGDDPGHEKVDSVQACGTSRDGTVLGNPCGTSDVYGKYTTQPIAVPPVPSRIDFSPPPGYLSNFTYLNATPNERIDLGVVYLERQVEIRAEIVDEVTKGAITNSQGSLTICQSLTGTCQLQGQLSGGSTLIAFGPPGVDFVKVEVLGYMKDTHSIGFVPKLGPGHVFDAGTIYLIPGGGFTLNTGVTYNKSTSAPKWGNGFFDVSVSSLDGFEAVGLVCGPFGGCNTTTSSTWFDFCDSIPNAMPRIQWFGGAMRIQVSIRPDWTPLCNPFGPMWPIPALEPVWGNTTELNITPRIVIGGSVGIYLNLTPGTYLAGNLTSNLLPLGLKQYQVNAQSMSNPTLDQYPYIFDSIGGMTSPWMCGGEKSIPQPSGTYGHSFCVPVPAGPAKVIVSANGFESNWTWSYSQFFCCNTTQEPEVIGSATLEHTLWINLTAPGAVYGHAFQNNTTLAVQFGSYQICTASNNPNLPCWTGAVNNDGSFYSPAPLGWDYVRVSASGYSPNTAWVHVLSNSSAGNITLTPVATLYGQVVDTLGHGLTAASITECQIGAPVSQTCGQFGAGLASTNGKYQGTIEGGWLPWSTYRITASAAGFTTDWVWVNATPGQITRIPTIVLQQIGVNATSVHAAAAAAASASSAGVWVDGRFVDNQSGYGVQPASISACPTSGGGCTLFTDGANPGGYFNGSVPSGLYNLTVSLAGYYPVNVSFNASGRAFVHLGSIQLVPYGFVAGRAYLNPWNNLEVTIGSRIYTYNLFPGSTATGCANSGYTCGTPLTVDSIGLYNVSAPSGVYDRLRVVGLFTGNGPSAPGGFTANSTFFNMTGYVASANVSVNCDFFGAISGSVRDNSTFNPVTGTDRLPVRWPSISETTVGNASANVQTTGGGDGHYVIFLPTGNTNNSIFVVASNPNMFYPMAARVPGVITPGGLIDVDQALHHPIQLDHYGWINAQIVDSVTGKGVGYVGVSSFVYDAKTGNSYAGSGIANGGGFVNISSPIGAKVLFTAGPAVDYNSSNVTVRVNASATGFANGTGPTDLGSLKIPPWGWISSLQVNSSVTPTLTTVIDPSNLLPVPDVGITVTTSDGILIGSSQPTNWQGQFLSDAPIGGKDTLTVKHLSYLTNNTLQNIAPGEMLAMRTVNLTAHGVLAGKVVGYPSELPIAGALITACPPQSAACTQSVSNNSGLFWIDAVPGLEQITIDASGYVSNASIVAKAFSDAWSWIGPVTLNQFAYVSGVVRGLPSGLPVNGATVSACSPLGNPVGPCGFFVRSTSSGGFLLSAPPGTYVLQVNDTDYNTSYLHLSLNPGQAVNVGTVFLNEFGAVIGSVLSSTSFAPIAGAAVYACPDWNGYGCLSQTNTTSNGHYVLFGPPGPYTLTISAPGFQDSYSTLKIVSGITSTAPTLLLTPLGTAQSYLVSGLVVQSANPSTGIAGAVVKAILNGTPAFSTVTNAKGQFALGILYGSYTLVAEASGWAPQSISIVVHAPVSGVLFSLSPMTYSITGQVTDGLSHLPIAGVAIMENGQQLSVTDAGGKYSAQLTNGSHLLVAQYLGSGPVPYADLPFVVLVNGLGFVHDLTLYPPTTLVYGTVVDQSSGLPIADAQVQVTGQSVENVPVSLTFVTDVAGHFTVALAQGTYTISTSHAGYSAYSKTVTAASSSASTPLVVPLAPMATSANGGQASGLDWTPIALFVVLGAATLFALWAFVSRSRSKPDASLKRRPPSTPK